MMAFYEQAETILLQPDLLKSVNFCLSLSYRYFY